MSRVLERLDSRALLRKSTEGRRLALRSTAPRSPSQSRKIFPWAVILGIVLLLPVGSADARRQLDDLLVEPAELPGPRALGVQDHPHLGVQNLKVHRERVGGCHGGGEGTEHASQRGTWELLHPLEGLAFARPLRESLEELLDPFRLEIDREIAHHQKSLLDALRLQLLQDAEDDSLDDALADLDEVRPATGRPARL